MIDDFVEFQPHLAQNQLLQNLLITRTGISIVHVVMEHQLLLLASEGVGKHLDFVGNDDYFLQIYILYRYLLCENDFSKLVPNLKVANFVQFLKVVSFEFCQGGTDRKCEQLRLLLFLFFPIVSIVPIIRSHFIPLLLVRLHYEL